MLKKFTSFLFLFGLLIGSVFLTSPVSAESVVVAESITDAEARIVASSDNPILYLFHGEECPHCKDEREFLKDLKEEIPNLEIKEFETWHNETNRKAFLKIADRMGVNNPAVPFTIIGSDYHIGFDNAESHGVIIRNMVKKAMGEDVGIISDFDTFELPLIGTINLKKLSLPVLTVILGTLDGFNPCSMWALFVLLTLLINTGSRKKIWLVGGTFIGVSAVSYFLFMSAWLNAFVFVGYLQAIQIVIGVVALVAGYISLKEFFTHKPNVCEVSTPEQQVKITKKMEEVMKIVSLPAMLLGVAGIAFSVNLVELMCSLGIPVVFTKTLAGYLLPTWKYYGYIALYTFFYLLDDLIVLAIAGFSMEFFLMNDKYTRFSRLIGGILMVILGLIFLIKPEILTF